MAQQNINIGTPNGQNGDFVRDAFSKAEDNFTELYARALTTGLESLNEGNGIGWRLVGRDTANYGSIGKGAVDFIESSGPGTTEGVTGDYSLGAGYLNKVASPNSAAFGYNQRLELGSVFSFTAGSDNETNARYTAILGQGTWIGTGSEGSFAAGQSHFIADNVFSATTLGEANWTYGSYSLVAGRVLRAQSSGEIVLGDSNTEYTRNAADSFTWNDADRLFVIGNGPHLGVGQRSDALIILKDGTITAPSLDNTKISLAGDKALVTKEYLGLEKIDLTTEFGWRLQGRDPANFGQVGRQSIDMIDSWNPSIDNGVTGRWSFGVGAENKVSGDFAVVGGIDNIVEGNSSAVFGDGNTILATSGYSAAIGRSNYIERDYNIMLGQWNVGSNESWDAIGIGSYNNIYSANGVALGFGLASQSYGEVVTGLFNTEYTRAGGSYDFNGADRLFVIGNGQAYNNRSDAFIILKDGTITAPSLDDTKINNAGNKALVTKEYLDTAVGGSGDVTKVGTPVNNQIGIWTGDGTIEGDAAFTYDSVARELILGDGTNYSTLKLLGNSTNIGGQLVFGTGGNTYANDTFYIASSLGNFNLGGDVKGTILGYDGAADNLAVLANTFQLSNYGSGTITGTPTYSLAVDVTGNVIEGPIATGDVTKVGTPVDNQVGVWTGDGTLEGNPRFTYTDSGLEIGQNDSWGGIARIYGAGNHIGGQLFIYNGAGGDTDDDYYQIAALSGEFAIKTPATEILTYNSLSGVFDIAKNFQLSNYGAGTITGTPTQGLAVDASGNVIETELSGVQNAKVTLSASEVNNIGTTPITLIAAPGAGKFIKVISVSGRLNWNTTAFSNNVLELNIAGAGSIYGSFSNFLNSTSVIINTPLLTVDANTMVENAAFQARGTDSVATGDSPVDLYITYEIINL